MTCEGWTRLAATVLVFSVAVLLAMGCANRCTDPDENVEDPYPARSCPDNVLAKLRMAYVAMDADAYLDCLADAFTFYLVQDDWQDPNPDLPECWDKSVEDTIHQNMFGEDTDVQNVTLVMMTETVDFDPGADPGSALDDRWSYEEDVDLRVRVVNDLTYLANADQLFVFAIEPGRLDTLWQIVEWREVDPWWSRGEDSNWGSIKALWR